MSSAETGSESVARNDVWYGVEIARKTGSIAVLNCFGEQETFGNPKVFDGATGNRILRTAVFASARGVPEPISGAIFRRLSPTPLSNKKRHEWSIPLTAQTPARSGSVRPQYALSAVSLITPVIARTPISSRPFATPQGTAISHPRWGHAFMTLNSNASYGSPLILARPLRFWIDYAILRA
jgi:hypothetical protein